MKTHRYFQAIAISFALIFAGSAPAYGQSPQNNPASRDETQKFKDQIQKIGLAEDVTVILSSGLEYYGAISKIESDSFEIAEVDLRRMITIAFADVMKVEKGYGPMNSSTGKREKPLSVKSHSGLVLFIVGVGAVIGMMVFAFKKLGKREPAAPPFPRFP